MSECLVRQAESSDIEAICAIYNHYVLTSTATFDTVVKSLEERRAWLDERSSLHPVLVAVREGGVVAWGALSPWATRPAWAQTVEVSIYVHPENTGAGIGPALVEKLVEAASRAGHHALVAQIVADNAASLKLAARAGFTQAGVLREVGRKFDRWLDVVLVERIL